MIIDYKYLVCLNEFLQDSRWTDEDLGSSKIPNKMDIRKILTYYDCCDQLGCNLCDRCGKFFE